MIDPITILRAKEAGLPAAESHPDPALAAFPLRSDWERTQPVVPESHEWPAPEKTATVVTEYGGKSAVADMVKRAQANGWTVVVTESKGAWPSVGQKPSRQRTSYAVRMTRGQERAVGVYVEGPSEGSAWSWDVLYRWDAGVFPVVIPMVKDFNASLVRWLRPV